VPIVFKLSEYKKLISSKNINGFEAPPQPKNRPAQVYFIPKLISAAVGCHGHLEIS
jgi:hypothetical protein